MEQSKKSGLVVALEPSTSSHFTHSPPHSPLSAPSSSLTHHITLTPLQITRLTDCECVEPIIVSLTAPDADLADFDVAQFTAAAAAALQVTPDQLLVRATVFCLM
jgi:hypothetical protein